MTWTDRGPDAIVLHIAALRFDEITRRLIDEAAELRRSDQLVLGGTGQRFAEAEASLQSVATRLSVCARALQTVASACRSRAATIEGRP